MVIGQNLFHDFFLIKYAYHFGMEGVVQFWHVITQNVDGQIILLSQNREIQI